MKDTKIFIAAGTNKSNPIFTDSSTKNKISKSIALKELFLFAAFLLGFVATYSQSTSNNIESAANEANIISDDREGKVLMATFCINGNLASNNEAVVLCSDTPVHFSLCEIENGLSPLSVCWTVNGVETCENDIFPGDVLFESTFEQGNNSIQVTSIVDSRGYSNTNLNAFHFNFETLGVSSVSAGQNMTICEGFNHTLSQATAENYNSLFWTGGDGIFVPSAETLKPLYIPGPQDIMNGGTNLCLSAVSENPCTSVAADCISLVIQQNAAANAGEDITVCQAQDYVTLDGLVFNGAPVWEETMFTGGFFENANAASTNYYFSAGDIELGTIELCLLAVPLAPCYLPQTDCMSVTIVKSPTVNAGPDISACANEPVYLDQAIVENYTTVQWTTGGDGIFIDRNSIHPTYLPGANDLLTGEVQLCLNVYGQGACTNAISDCMIIDFIQAPLIDLQAERSLNLEDYDIDNAKWLPVEIGNTVSGDYNSIEWMTNGDGTFDDANAESPVYFPGLHDIWNGEIVIWVNITPAAECHDAIFQGMTLHIPQQLVFYDQDGWNGISSYLSTDLSEVTEIMEPLVQIPGSKNLVSMFDIHGKVFMPEFNPPLATLTNWEPVGYKINLKNTTACLPVYGDSLTDQTFTVEGAFTYLPTLTNVPVSIESLFEGHLDDVMLILDWSGNKLWTPIASDFDSIYPGYAYLLVNQSGIDPYTIEFPDFVADAPLIYPAHHNKNAQLNHSPWAEVEKSDMPHILTFTGQALAKLQPGDILGAFDKNGECFGMAEYNNHEGIYKLIAMGKSSISADNNGFAEGETMYFRVYNPLNGQESEVTFIFDESYPSNTGKFMSNSLSMVADIVLKSSSTDQASIASTSEVRVYPNPASDYLNISSEEEIEEIQILSSSGLKVSSTQANAFSSTLNVSDLGQGIYILIIKHTNQHISTHKFSIR